MWSDFYAAGGWGMYPVTLFGFFLVVASALYAFRRRPQHLQLAAWLAVMTFVAGVLGTATGICNSAFYLHKVEATKQLGIFALGMQESLHDVMLSCLFMLFAGLVAGVGVVRESAVQAA